jgi:pimeloyl-ACP methyl ester carboxylesterase
MRRAFGTFSPLALGVALAAPALAASEPVRLETPTGALHGTLELPEGQGPWPVALVVAGSGPTDRDGNSAALRGRNDSLKLLAEGLARGGVASLRYDKRGVGQSLAPGLKEEELRFEAIADDAAAWLERLRADRRFHGVAVIGHSEGSLVGLLAAREGRADAFVSLEGAGRRASDLLRTQLEAPAAGLTPALLEESRRIVAELEAGRTVASPSPALAALFRPSVQPYLVSWFRYDPAAELAALGVPALVVQGTTDLQTSVADARRLAAAREDASLVLVEGMNHVLKRAPADPRANLATYTDPSLPLAPGLLEPILAFLREKLPR